MEKKNIVCLPGWACLRQVHTWMGFPVICHDHLRQQSLWDPTGGFDAADWIPDGPWCLVTWSMGGWSGLHLSRHWAHNPPALWVALSPFRRLVGDLTRINIEGHRMLRNAFESDPLRTLEFFSRQHGGETPWVDREKSLEHRAALLAALDLLAGEAPEPSGNITVPLKVLYGVDDRLIDRSMVEHFAELFETSQIHEIPHCGHALFYEEPEPVARWVRTWLE